MRAGYICFDLETTGLIEDQVAPSVLCAATIKVHVQNRQTGALECECPRVWHEPDHTVMRTESLSALVGYLNEQLRLGFPPVSWNGSGFDFRVLHMLLGEDAVPAVCKQHTDLCFNVFVHKGFPVKLSAVAAGFGCENKTDTGANAPVLWGTPEGCAHVINYCQQDVIVLASVLSCIMASRSVKWVSKTGKVQCFRQHFDMLWPIHISSKRRVADNSWMRAGQPLNKDQFVGWLK